MEDLDDFIKAMVSPTKIAAEDLSSLSLNELEALLGFGVDTDIDKVAGIMDVKECGPSTGPVSWLDQFVGTPLYAKAMQLCESEIELEQQTLQRRLYNEANSQADSQSWTQRDIIRLQKDMLMLELHKAKSQGPAGGKDPTLEVAVEAPAAEPEPKKQAGLLTTDASKNDRPHWSSLLIPGVTGYQRGKAEGRKAEGVVRDVLGNAAGNIALGTVGRGLGATLGPEASAIGGLLGQVAGGPAGSHFATRGMLKKDKSKKKEASLLPLVRRRK